MNQHETKEQRWERIKAQLVSAIWAFLAFCLVFLLGLAVTTQIVPIRDLRAPIGIALAVFSAALVYVMSMQKKSRYAKCPSCSAPFSLTLKDREKELVASTPRQTRKLVSRSANDGTPNYRHDSWVDETYRVVDTMQCAKCGEQFERKFTNRARSGFTSTTDW
jgi:DNA-directed RNA polymerase subunit RPC12/RpoP